MAGVSLENNHWEAAKDKFIEALEIKRKVAGPESLEVSESYNNISMLAFLVFRISGKKFKDSDAPDRLLRISLKIREEKLGPEDPKVADTLGLLAVVLYYHSQYLEAEAAAKRCLAIYEKLQGPDGKDVAIALQHYARIHRHLGSNPLKSWKESHDLEARSKAILKKIEDAKRARNDTSNR